MATEESQEHVMLQDDIVDDSSNELEIMVVNRRGKIYSKKEQDIMQYAPLEQQPSFVERVSMRLCTGVSNCCSCLLVSIFILLIITMALLIRLVILQDAANEDDYFNEQLMGDMGEQLLAENETNAVLSDPTSPQYKALAWITNQDPLQESSINDLIVERYILAVLYYSTNGDLNEWGGSTNWLSTSSICDWEGIQCDKTTNHRVSEVILDSNYLAGTVASELGRLSALSVLHLHVNKLTGTIPSQLGQLTQIEFLDFDNNELTGSIPTELGNLSALRFLSMDHNSLTGTLPSELGQLTKINFLDFEYNNFSGTLPRELAQLTDVNYLYFGGNKLTGSIPTEFGHLTETRELEFHDNYLTGTVPTELNQLLRLMWLRVDTNDVVGSLNELFCDPTTDYTTMDTARFVNLTAMSSDCVGGATTPRITCDCCTECW